MLAITISRWVFHENKGEEMDFLLYARQCTFVFVVRMDDCHAIEICLLWQRKASPVYLSSVIGYVILHMFLCCSSRFAHNSHAAARLQVSHGAIQFMVYEELKTLAGRPGLRGSLGLGSNLTGLEVSAMGAASKLAAVLATYPQQVGLCLNWAFHDWQALLHLGLDHP